MKKIFYGLILCTVLLGGCSAKGENGISETSVPVTNSVAVTMESSAETVSETETAATTRATTVTEPAEEEIILTPIPSKEPFEVSACDIIEDIAVDSEDDFPDKEAVKRAKEICFEKAHDRIEDHNDTVERGIYRIRVETAEDIVFSCGMALDFDGDGSDEYVVALDFRPTNPMGGSSLVLMDGSEYMIDIIDFGITDMELILNSGVYFPMVTYIGPTWKFTNVYSFGKDKPLKISPPEKGMGGPYSIIYKDNIFYRTAKYEQIYEPFILCGGGVFRQIGREKISREDFETHVQNGGKYLDSLAGNGETITEIYTYGYYHYELYGEGFRYDIYGNYFADDNTFLTEKVDCDGVHGELYFTDEVVYGDVWAVKEIN